MPVEKLPALVRATVLGRASVTRRPAHVHAGPTLEQPAADLRPPDVPMAAQAMVCALGDCATVPLATQGRTAVWLPPDVPSLAVDAVCASGDSVLAAPAMVALIAPQLAPTPAAATVTAQPQGTANATFTTLATTALSSLSVPTCATATGSVWAAPASALPGGAATRSAPSVTAFA